VKTKQPPKAKSGKLDRKEWDFRKIPKPEIEACFIYEYARELARRSPGVLDLFILGQIGWSAGKKTPQFSEGRKVCQEFRKTMTDCVPDFLYLYLYGDWFPDTSWQGVDQNVRSELVKEVNYGRQHRWNSLPSVKIKSCATRTWLSPIPAVYRSGGMSFVAKKECKTAALRR
jgi:hypothetical protein